MYLLEESYLPKETDVCLSGVIHEYIRVQASWIWTSMYEDNKYYTPTVRIADMSIDEYAHSKNSWYVYR